MTSDNQFADRKSDSLSDKRPRSDKEVESSKKTKLENLAAPKYGEQSYWEDRYKQLLSAKSLSDQTDNDDDAPLAYHSWYFSYPELKPILLPLILGSGQDVQEFISKSTDTNDVESEESDQDSQAEEKPESINKEAEGIFVKEEDEDDGSQSIEEQDETEETTTAQMNSSEAEEGDDLEEIESDDDDENDEESINRGLGLTAVGPIEILEIGCGDVPLLAGLYQDLESLGQTTNSDISSFVKRLRCVDYSPTVIEKMKEHYGRKVEPNGKSESLSLEFAVADGRQLEMDEKSVDLIIEKGCLDGMLSDPKNGVENCRKMVTECARVLVPGGCLILVSHSNAHTDHGMQWLQDIVFNGLQRLGKVDPKQAMYKWEVEVHGNDMESLIDEYGDNVPDDASPGPAVYIVHKQSAVLCQSTTDRRDVGNSSAIKVKFLSY